MMKEGGIVPNNEYHPYANGNMQHMNHYSRQTPDSGLGTESMNNAGAGGDNSGPPAGGRPPPGFAENPYFVGNVQQSPYNEQHQQQYRPKQYGGQQDGGRFERGTGPPSIMTMPTSPPNMDQEGGGPSYNPNYANYPQQQYGNPGGPPYGGMDRNFNPPHPMAARSHSNFSESSSSTLNPAGGGGPPDPSALSGQPLMAAGPHGGMMYPQHAQGGPMGGPLSYGHPHMQQHQQAQMQQQSGGPNPYFLNQQQAAAAAAHAAAMQQHAHAQMMQQGGPMVQQQGGPLHHPHGIPMQQSQQPGGGALPPSGGPPLSASPPQHQQPMMMMHMPGGGGPHGPSIIPGATVFYPQHAMMQQRPPLVGQGHDGFIQFTYPNQQQQQAGFNQMRMHPQLQQQRSMNSPAPSDITDGQSVQGGSIGTWNGPPDQQQQQQQHTPPPSVMQPMQPQGGQQMHPGMQQGMGYMPVQMMTASYPGAAGVPPFGGPPGGPRMMAPNPPYNHAQIQQMALQHMQQQGMPPMQQMHGYLAGGFPQQQQQQQQPNSGYWQGPPNQRGGYRGGGRGRGGWGGSSDRGGSRPGSRSQYSNHWSKTSFGNTTGGGNRSMRSMGGDAEESSKCTTPNEDDIVDVTGQMDAMRMGGGDHEGQQAGGHSTVANKQLLELADPKSSCSPPAEPNPSDDDSESVAVEMNQEESAAAAGSSPPTAATPTTPRAEPRKELLEMKRTPKHEAIPVDPVPPQAAASSSAPIAAAATAMKWSEVAAKPSCVYCRGKNRPAEEYSTHNLRDPSSNAVTCPLFASTGCSYCGQNGPDGHDAFFCEKRIAKEAAAGGHSGHHDGGAGGDVHPSTHGGDGGGAYRGGGGSGQKRGGGQGQHYSRGGRGGQQGKYENRRMQ